MLAKRDDRLLKKFNVLVNPAFEFIVALKKMPRILGGFGIAIVSTSVGLMTDQQARKEGVGGEILCYIC
jgi:small subunit ribosomal protein S8